jgi:methylated-DNA-[protein]-cysteine S-methyltransferase
MTEPTTSTSTGPTPRPTHSPIPSPTTDTDALTGALTGFEPAVRPPVLGPTDVSYVVDDTPIGRMLLARNKFGALVASTFVPTSADEDRVLALLSRRVSPRVLRHPSELDEARRQLDAFLAGRTRTFTLRTDLALASGFQRAVLSRLAASVSYGHRATYGQLAALVDRPAAARAVGTALGSNPLCVVIPCHRVVGASGALTGYAGGLAAKRYLLELESGHAAPER